MTLPAAMLLAAVLFASRAASTAAQHRPSDAPQSAMRECAFEIASNKPFVQVKINGSGPEWFILDTGCSGGSVIAKECADRLGLGRGDETSRHLGAGAGVSVGVATTPDVTLEVAGDTMSAPALRVFSLAHVSPLEGRRVNGLLGEDFLRRHVVEIDYAVRRIRIFERDAFTPAAHGVVVPIALENGLAVAAGSIAPPGRAPISCRLVIDTGVRGTVILYHPFAVEHRLLDVPGNLVAAMVGGGAGGETRGDIGRLDSLRIGPVPFLRPTAIFSRDTAGVFSEPDPDGIVGGELLRRCRVTFDYPHERLILEPYAEPQPAMEYDMSGVFLVAMGDDFHRLVIQSVTARTPATDAGLRKGDEILAVDGQRPPGLTLEGLRQLFRVPGKHRLRLQRSGRQVEVWLATRRLV
jgi:hypothetical protein